MSLLLNLNTVMPTTNKLVFSWGTHYRARRKQTIINQLQQNGYDLIDLSNDDIAKTHVRYMIGGRSNSPLKERLYSFEFPEQKAPY